MDFHAIFKRSNVQVWWEYPKMCKFWYFQKFRCAYNFPELFELSKNQGRTLQRTIIFVGITDLFVCSKKAKTDVKQKCCSQTVILSILRLNRINPITEICYSQNYLRRKMTIAIMEWFSNYFIAHRLCHHNNNRYLSYWLGCS